MEGIHDSASEAGRKKTTFPTPSITPWTSYDLKHILPGCVCLGKANMVEIMVAGQG
jgi:hypothetical protein